MMFCPKCGSILSPKEDKGKRFLACQCGYTDKKTKGEIKEKSAPKEKLVIVDENETSNAIVDEKCPKCGHEKAEFWSIQTRASDEPETNFYKCVKCKHTWRGD